MYLKQSDLFWQLDHDFVRRVMAATTKEKYEAGQVLFREGDPAHHFYVLIKGQVRLSIGDQGQVIQTVSRPGECFGWSALLDRVAYSASALCRAPTDLIRIHKNRFTPILEADPANGLIFMKHLAGMLGNRLIRNYQLIFSLATAAETPVYGSNQVVETAADIQ